MLKETLKSVVRVAVAAAAGPAVGGSVLLLESGRLAAKALTTEEGGDAVDTAVSVVSGASDAESWLDRNDNHED